MDILLQRICFVKKSRCSFFVYTIFQFCPFIVQIKSVFSFAWAGKLFKCPNLSPFLAIFVAVKI